MDEPTIFINDFLGIAIVGVLLSLALEKINAKFGFDTAQSRAVAVILSIAIGGLYWFLQGTAMWQSIIGVLAAASTVYALFFSGKKAEDKRLAPHEV